jgi:ADP-ribose pyrophosphatase
MPEVTRKVVEFETPWFQVVAKTLNGMPGTSGQDPYYSLKMDDYVSVLAIDCNDQILLVRQYRPAVEDYTLELPSGHVGKDASPEEAAKRELIEETGHEAENLELLGCLVPDAGRLPNKMWCYFASGVKPKEEANITEEGIDLIKCNVDDLKKYIEDSKFNHALNIAVMMLAAIKGKLPLICH